MQCARCTVYVFNVAPYARTNRMCITMQSLFVIHVSERASERMYVCSEVVNEVQHKTINRNPLLFSRQFFFALESVFSPVYAALALAALFVLSLFVLASVSGV